MFPLFSLKIYLLIFRQFMFIDDAAIVEMMQRHDRWSLQLVTQWLNR
jgi:hypothetical protein